MPKRLTEKLVSITITVTPEIAAELKQRAKHKSKPGAKVSQGDIVSELLSGRDVDPEQMSSFNRPKKEPREKVKIVIPEESLPDWRKPESKGERRCPHGRGIGWKCIFCRGIVEAKHCV